MEKKSQSEIEKIANAAKKQIDDKVKIKPFYFIVQNDVYPFDIMVSVDEDKDVLAERLIDTGQDEDVVNEIINLSKNTLARSGIFESNALLLILKVNGKNRYELMSILAHEAFHLTTLIMDRIGMKFKIGVSDEAYAYLIAKIYFDVASKIKL
jgi:hypothetical protein